MTSLEDYLTMQLYIEKNVVTFRSLSRQFTLHVNVAKNELAKFHQNSVNSETRYFATYLISGELFPKARAQTSQKSLTQTDDGMDVDSEVARYDDADEEEEETPTTTLTLVGENDLEHAKSKYARIFSTHVYCLSPSPLTQDAGLICDPSVIVYKADAKDFPTSSIAIGRVVGPDVRLGKTPPPVASSSKAGEPISRKPTLKVKEESASSKEASKEKSNTVKPKPSGRLDWSKAKKTSDSEKGKGMKVKKEESPIPKVEKMAIKSEEEESPREEKKRGTKRKGAPPLASDTEGKPQVEKPVPVPSAKIRKNRIVSDDEDEEEASRARQNAKGKAKIANDMLESDAERSLRAMMDIDDSQVERASAGRSAPKREPDILKDEDVEMVSEPETQQPPDEDEDMAEETPKPKPRKKKEKKVVPIGRNGLKKKRVVKTRMTTDAKGYMVAEDYSEYESVDEEEPEEEKKPKGKKATNTSTKAKRNADEDSSAKSKPAARSNSAKSKGGGAKMGAQGSLKDFFGKPRK